MARRIINKACNDLVGGAGADVSVNLGVEIPRKPSALKLASRDPNHGIRQAVEVKPIDVRQMPKGPLQVIQASRRDNVKLEEKGGKSYFVNIDGDGSVTEVDAPRVQQPRAGPQTAYKMRSFMSSVDPRGHSRSPAKPTNLPPRREPRVPKVSRQPDDVKMFLPKGIHRTDQPYVVPKFMPTYREMMVPKPKPDPLVSIVEATPPSLQKWAVEWNAEPKKTISIDELKEDLIREATEKSHKPPKSQLASTIHGPNTDEMYEDKKSDEPNSNTLLKNHLNCAEPVEKTYPNASEKSSPWNDLHVPTSYETRMENHRIGNPDPEHQKIGRPLVDRVPLKYSSPTKYSYYNPRDAKYSFQEVINNGVSKKTSKSETGESKLFLPEHVENSVYYDTEEQRFHNWFKEKMAAAAQSAVNRPKATMKNNHPQYLVPQSDFTFSAVKDPNKPFSMSSANPIGQNNPAQSEDNPMTRSNRWKDMVIPTEIVAHPKPTNNAPVTSYERESNSSFYHWLKLRGHHIAKNEPNPLENKKEKEKPDQLPQNVPLFPWSVSYTLRKRVSTPTLIPKRLSTPTAVPKRPTTAKNVPKFQKSVSHGGTNLGHVKSSIRKSVNSIGRKSISPGKKLKQTDGKRFVKSAGKKPLKNNSKVYTKNSIKKISKAELPRAPAPPEHSWLNDSWLIDSEIDHVNNLRKMEVFGNSPKAANLKKLFPSMGGQQMKYWESKYGKKPESLQNKKVPQGLDNQCKMNSYNWYMPKKATNRADNVFKKATLENADNCTGRDDKRSNFSTIDEGANFPSNISQNAKDEVMDFSEDFDIDSFLCKEEAVEKELTKSMIAEQEKKVEADGKSKNEQNSKVKGKVHIKFPRIVKAQTEEKDVDLNKRVQQKLDEDEFVMALGEDSGQEDLEWSEFIGPKNSLDHDSDLTRLFSAQERQLGTAKNSCL